MNDRECSESTWFGAGIGVGFLIGMLIAWMVLA